MALRQSDYNQAARYLKYACDLLEREAPAKTRAVRKVLAWRSGGSRLAITL